MQLGTIIECYKEERYQTHLELHPLVVYKSNQLMPQLDPIELIDESLEIKLSNRITVYRTLRVIQRLIVVIK